MTDLQDTSTWPKCPDCGEPMGCATPPTPSYPLGMLDHICKTRGERDYARAPETDEEQAFVRACAETSRRNAERMRTAALARAQTKGRDRGAEFDRFVLDLSDAVALARQNGIPLHPIAHLLVRRAALGVLQARRTWDDFCRVVREAWHDAWQFEQGRPAPAANECECRHLTLVDVPRSKMNPADPHHPTCEHYTPPPDAVEEIVRAQADERLRLRELGVGFCQRCAALAPLEPEGSSTYPPQGEQRFVCAWGCADAGANEYVTAPLLGTGREPVVVTLELFELVGRCLRRKGSPARIYGSLIGASAVVAVDAGLSEELARELVDHAFERARAHLRHVKANNE